MTLKLTLAAAVVAGSAMSAQAGGLLDAQTNETVTPVVIDAPAQQGSLGGILPYLLIGGAIALAVGSGGGS